MVTLAMTPEYDQAQQQQADAEQHDGSQTEGRDRENGAIAGPASTSSGEDSVKSQFSAVSPLASLRLNTTRPLAGTMTSKLSIADAVVRLLPESAR